MKHAKRLLLAASWILVGNLAADETSFPEILDPGIPGHPQTGSANPDPGRHDTHPHREARARRPGAVGLERRWQARPSSSASSKPTRGRTSPWGADGSTIRVYLNVGTDADPKFTDEFEWARDTEGTILEVPQWCCIGFTPQFYDLDDDGHLDMITGQYHPGDVTWFRGTGTGFLPGVTLPQEGDPNSNGNPMFGNYDGAPGDIGTFHYWVYSSASFGDLDDDGDYDLIVGGGDGLRVSENIGSPRRPSFAMREALLTLHGEPLRILDRGPEWDANFPEGDIPPPDGDGKSSPLVVDWDDDGVLDLLVTGSYRHPASHAVTFFRGVKTDDGHRFHPGIDLLPTADGAKALPGSGQRVYVDDWNRDGVKDLIIGASVATVNDGEFSDELSWEWEDVNNVESAGKDPGLYPPRERPTAESMAASRDYYEDDEEFQAFVKLNQDYWYDTVGRLYDEGKAHWLSMRHQGRVYVMLGERREATPVTAVAVPVRARSMDKRSAKNTTIQPPVTVALVAPAATRAGEPANIAVSFTMRPGWYIYAPTGRNAPHGMIETSVEFGLPDGIEAVGARLLPLHHFKGLYDIYEGTDREWAQRVEASASGRYELTATVTYQTCKDDLCLPPRTESLSALLAVVEPDG